MGTTNSFGVHFILRMNKAKNGIVPIYVRISVNGERIEMSPSGLYKPKGQMGHMSCNMLTPSDVYQNNLPTERIIIGEK